MRMLIGHALGNLWVRARSDSCPLRAPCRRRPSPRTETTVRGLLTHEPSAYSPGHPLVPAANLVAVRYQGWPQDHRVRREAALMASARRGRSQGPVRGWPTTGPARRSAPEAVTHTAPGQPATTVPAGPAPRPRVASGIGPIGQLIGRRTQPPPRRRGGALDARGVDLLARHQCPRSQHRGRDERAGRVRPDRGPGELRQRCVPGRRGRRRRCGRGGGPGPNGTLMARTPTAAPSHDREGPPFLLVIGVERATGIEPAWPAWKAGALPLSYARMLRGNGAAQAYLAQPSCVTRAVVEAGSGWSRRLRSAPLGAPGCGAAW
jgi:hypothetical protein